MATKREPRNASEAAASVFDGFDVLEGFEPVDKAGMVGVPFGVTAVRFRTNDRSIEYAEIELVTGDGEEKALNDASSGIRDQLKAYLAERGTGMDEDGWAVVKLFVPHGLRVSEYEVTDERGRSKQAKTYYLTTQARKRKA